MGAILDLPTEAEPYGAEVRSASFYLYSPDLFQPIDGGIAIPAADVDQILLVLDQVAKRPEVSAVVSEAVIVRREGDWLAVLGGDWLHVYGAPNAASGCIEIDYTHLEGLRQALAAL